jgi:hypothetical protein
VSGDICGSQRVAVVIGVAPTHVELDLARFLALVRRELGAVEVRILEALQPGEPDDPPEPLEMRAALPEGRSLSVWFAAEPEDRAAKATRLEALAATLDPALVDPAPRRSRPPAGLSLRDELRALCDRAGAVNTLIIDANSPVVWAAAHPDGLIGEAPLESTPVLPIAGPRPRPAADDASPAGSPARIKNTSRRALKAIRGLVAVSALRKGKRVRHIERAGKTPYLAHSFAGIYLAVAAFDAPFDELRAERAMVEALPRIERLVLALPPLDPSPETGGRVVSMRRPRRR